MAVSNAARVIQPRKTQASSLQVRKGGTSKLKKTIQTVAAVIMAAVALGLTISLLCTCARLSELTVRVQRAKATLNEELCTYDYLYGQLSAKTNLKTVENAADGELGMIKLDPSQITYFTMQSEDKVEKPESGSEKVAGVLQGTVSGIWAIMNP